MLTWEEKVKQNRVYEIVRYIATGNEDDPFDTYILGELTLKEATTLFNALYLQDGLECVKLIKEGYEEDELIKIKEA